MELNLSISTILTLLGEFCTGVCTIFVWGGKFRLKQNELQTFTKEMKEFKEESRPFRNEIKQGIEIQAEGLQSVLRENLLQITRKHIRLGYVDDHTRETVERMYKAYHNLGGNDIITGYYKQFVLLPPADD